jgi:hypothetical protein
MAHPSFKTLLQPWTLVTLILLFQMGTLFTPGTEAAA